MFVFQNIWRALFSWNTRFDIRPFALLPTFYRILFFSGHHQTVATFYHYFVHFSSFQTSLNEFFETYRVWEKNIGLNLMSLYQPYIRNKETRAMLFLFTTLKQPSRNVTISTAWKVSKYAVFSGPYFPNTGKYVPEKTPYLDTFHTVQDHE